METYKAYYLTYPRVEMLGKQNKVELFNAYNSLSRKPDPVKGYEVINGKAFIGVRGVLVPEADEWEEYWGYSSMAKIEESLMSAREDFTVNHIVLDMDSPGGTVQAVFPLAEKIFETRAIKRVTTLIRGEMCSGGLFLGAAADEIYSDSPTNLVGSIGVYLMHVEYGQSDAKVTYIKAGRYKTSGNPYEPITDDALQMYQRLVDNDYQIFVKSVAKYRNVEVEEVLANWADGYVFSASETVENGLIDGILSFDELIND